MKTIENNKKSIKNYLENLSANELVNIHNEYCDSVNDKDDYIYSNDEYFFAENFSGNFMKLAKAISFGDYRYQDEFIKFNGYGNLESFQEYNVGNIIDVDAILLDILDNSLKLKYHTDILRGK